MHSLKVSIITSHVSGWLILLSFPLIFFASQHSNNAEGFLEFLFSASYCTYTILFAFIFYLHTYFLLPYLYFKKRYAIYFLVLLFIMMIVAYVRPFDLFINNTVQSHQPLKDFNPNERLQPPQAGHLPPSPDFHNARNATGGPAFDIISILFFIFLIVAGIVIETSSRMRIAAQRTAEAEMHKVNAELSFLKAQINPHFLFNTLNNIYSLAVTKDDKTADAVLKLSNILRYVTDEASEEFVSLQNEINCLTDYIDLQQMRFNNNLFFDFEVKGNIEEKKISPLILMTFVENAFKYGISKHEPCPITVHISADEHQIEFFSRNKIFIKDTGEKRKKVGIANVKKRLDHLYASDYSLLINDSDGFYTVQFILKN